MSRYFYSEPKAEKRVKSIPTISSDNDDDPLAITSNTIDLGFDVFKSKDCPVSEDSTLTFYNFGSLFNNTTASVATHVKESNKSNMPPPKIPFPKAKRCKVDVKYAPILGESTQIIYSEPEKNVVLATDDTGNTNPTISGIENLSVQRPNQFDTMQVERLGPHVFQILKQIGAGGSSVVYSAHDLSDPGRIVAIKKVRMQSDQIAQIRDEAHTLQSLMDLGCTCVVKLYDYIERDDHAYFIMEYGSKDLQTLVTEYRSRLKIGNEQMAPAQAAELLNFIRHYFGQMVKCVQEIHEYRVIHADLKPANFLVVEGNIKLIDFGISKHMTNDTTGVRFMTPQGTLNYMAPETLVPDSNVQRVNRKIEVWSLGCILYFMVYGYAPFPAATPEVKVALIRDPNYEIKYPEIPGVAMESLVDAIKSCLKREPRERIDLLKLREHCFLYPDKSR